MGFHVGKWLFSALLFGGFAMGPNAVRASEELQIVSPPSLSSQFSYGGKSGVLQETPALFGIPSYQGGVTGRLYYSIPHDGCSPINATAVGVPSEHTGSSILFIDRGTCTFVTKVRNAENAGFQAVVVGNSKPDDYMAFMADDGTGRSLVTPSVLITLTDANLLRTAFSQQTAIFVSLTYSLPNPDNRVEFDLFTLSVDPLASTFKHTFGTAVKVLGEHALFTPHMATISGVANGCTLPSQPCHNQCSNKGRYCAADPDRDFSHGLSGRDVVQENVRQLCLWQYLNFTSPANIYKWFDYVVAFDGNCGKACPSNGTVDPDDPTNPSCANGWSDVCSYNQMDQLKLPSTQVRQCVTASGGTNSNDDTTNSILEQQILDMKQWGIFLVPILYINTVAYRGSLDCPTPLNPASCGPLSGICAGYKTGTEPQACATSPECEVGLVKDACGKCGGDGAYDACGYCQSVSSPLFNSTCKGCDGKVNSGKTVDACGVCGGPGTRLGTCLSTGAIVGIIIACVIAVAALVAAVCFYFKRQTRAMRDDFDSLMRQYLPLEGGTNQQRQTEQNARLIEEPTDL